MRRKRFEGGKPKEDEDKLVESRNEKEGELGSRREEFGSWYPSGSTGCRSRTRKGRFGWEVEER